MVTAIFRLLLIFFSRFGFGFCLVLVLFVFLTSNPKNLNNQQIWCWKDLLRFLGLFNEKYGEKGGMRSKGRSYINGSKTLSGNWKLMIMLRWVIKLDAVSDCSKDQVLVTAAAGWADNVKGTMAAGARTLLSSPSLNQGIYHRREANQLKRSGEWASQWGDLPSLKAGSPHARRVTDWRLES